jgi:hypothetical protein
MINHARTLLLNMPAKKARRDTASYEYVPAAFRPITLTSGLATIRATLFGSAPDNYFLNFRGRELLRYIHETDLSQYIYALDPRVTYWPEYNADDFSAVARLQLTQTAGQPRRISIAGQFNANNAAGRAARQYVVTLTPGNDTLFAANITELNILAAAATTTTFDDLNTAPALSVPQTSLKLRFSNTAMPVAPACNIITELGDMVIVEDYDPATILTVESETDCAPLPLRMNSMSSAIETARWLLDIRARPAPAITTIMPILEMLGEPILFDLFGPVTKEPYTTFKNLWFDHPLPAYKLSGLVLGFIYRCNEIYEHTNV